LDDERALAERFSLFEEESEGWNEKERKVLTGISIKILPSQWR